MPAGRPTDYDPAFCAVAKRLCERGATDNDLAYAFGVDRRTIVRWRLEHEEFCLAAVLGKEAADDAVERALYERAMGYTHPDTDIRVVDGSVVMTQIEKHYPPDPQSLKFWLLNRRRENWRERIDHNHTGTLGQLSDEEVEAQYAALMAKKDAGKPDKA